MIPKFTGLVSKDALLWHITVVDYRDRTVVRCGHRIDGPRMHFAGPTYDLLGTLSREMQPSRVYFCEDCLTEDAVRRHEENGFFGPIQRPEALHRLFMKGFLWVRSPSGEMKWLYMRDRIRAQYNVRTVAYRIGDKWYCNGSL